MTSGQDIRPAAQTYQQLACYRHCVTRIEDSWPAFAARRRQRLRQGLFEAPVEKVAENIVEDLFTTVLDWSLDDVNLQVGRADIVLSDHGIKRLVLEVKRPGMLMWGRATVTAALEQAQRYAAAQTVAAVAISDGNMLYAADLHSGGLCDRTLTRLDAGPPADLWWVSVHGIYRPCPPLGGRAGETFDVPDVSADADSPGSLLHPKYQLPPRCFAYVGNANDPRTWKLPYLLDTGSPDTKRLPKAIQSILSNYRGAKVTIPRESIADVLVRLARAAAALGKLPCQCVETSPAYVEAHHALEQLGRLLDVGCC